MLGPWRLLGIEVPREIVELVLKIYKAVDWGGLWLWDTGISKVQLKPSWAIFIPLNILVIIQICVWPQYLCDFWTTLTHHLLPPNPMLRMSSETSQVCSRSSSALRSPSTWYFHHFEGALIYDFLLFYWYKPFKKLLPHWKSNLNPCSQAMVTHIWPHNEPSLYSLWVESCAFEWKPWITAGCVFWPLDSPTSMEAAGAQEGKLGNRQMFATT